MKNKKESVSKKEGSEFTWETQGTLIYGSNDDVKSKLILGFDMDDTIIETKSNSKFAINADDWKFLYEESKMLDKLKQFLDKKFRIVIFTNQKGVSTGNANPEHLKKKIENISKELGIKLTAFIATNDDHFRKPKLGMWDLFKSKVNGDLDIDLKESIYCGDAAGRKTKTHKDFSDSDLFKTFLILENLPKILDVSSCFQKNSFWMKNQKS